MCLSLWLTSCDGAGSVEEAPPPDAAEAVEPVPDLAIPKPPPNREVPLPVVEPSLPGERKAVAHPLAPSPALTAARTTLAKLVHDHGRDPDNPWAVSHAMLALGPEVELSNGRAAVDHLFGTFAERVDVGGAGPQGHVGVAFPKAKGPIRIEPHADLVLKALVEGGLGPDRKVPMPDGGDAVLLDLYRHSLHRAWTAPKAGGYTTGFGSMNNTPWALQALSSWAPEGYGWKAIGSHDMTMNGFASASLAELETASQRLMSAKERGVMPRKDGKGILAYTCGGQHLVQGVAHATARGFGPDDAKARVCAQRDLLRWRIDHELGTLDPILASRADDRPLAIVLQDQRLKFLGHAMETLGKIDAYGYCGWSDADAQAQTRLAKELVVTVKALEKLGVFDDPQGVRTNKALDPYRPNSGGAEQVYLDLLGDSAHAVRGIDLQLGQGTIGY